MWILEYHEVCLTNKTSGIIENIKTAQRNKCEKQKKSISTKARYKLLLRFNEPWTSLILLDLSSFADSKFSN